MASQWFVLHGGKQHGPLTSATLKRLADEGKITPATSVRAGTEGAWGPASRVQGLFPPAAAAPSATPQAAASRPVAPPVTPPPAPPRADPLARPPMADPLARGPLVRAAVPRATPTAKAKADAGSMPAKILGAVALILGILALATSWLPVAGGLMGWIGIAVGSLGLLLGISALVVSALAAGSGLALSIAGTSTSVVGLVLTVVLGVLFGMFDGAPAPKPVAVIAKVLPPAAPPKQEMPPPKEPEPEPEPQWTDAGEPIEQGNVRARIVSTAIEKVRLESMDLSTLKAAKPQPKLVVKLSIENIARDKIVDVPGWTGVGGDLVSQEVKNLLGNTDIGKAVQQSSATAVLKDNFGNNYAQTSQMSIVGAGLKAGATPGVRPGQTAQSELVFDVPLDTVEYLRLELSPAGFSGSEPLRFQIPKANITGL